MLEKMAVFGIVAGEPFDPESLGPTQFSALEMCVEKAQMTLNEQLKNPPLKLVNGCWVPLNLGKYGTSYALRAFVTKIWLGANKPRDAVYPRTTIDSERTPLEGRNKYVLHFEKDSIPPVNAFWSLTMHNSKQSFTKNPIDRYAIGDRDKLKFNSDGSLDILVQSDSPGTDKESNWLPGPTDTFNLMLRLYWPKPSVFHGDWVPSAPKKVG